MKSIGCMIADRAVLGLILSGIMLGASGCDKKDEEKPKPAEKKDPLVAEYAMRKAVADGTIYVFSGSGARWIVKEKYVEIPWDDGRDYYFGDEGAWNDAYGGVYVRGKTGLWYFRNGVAKKVQSAKVDEIRDEDHKLTQRSATWAAIRERETALYEKAYEIGHEAAIEDAKTTSDSSE